MGELLVAVALLCQVTGNHTGMDNLSYEKAKEKQKICQKKLVKCIYESDELTTPRKLATCIEKGDY